MKRRLYALAGALALAAAPAAMADRVPQVHALTGVRIVVAPGKVIESGTLVVRDGLIEAVGAEVAVPADARVWKLEKTTVYPGLIDAYHALDWPVADKDEPSKAVHPNALIRPERDATAIAWNEAEIAKLREAGFTTALFAPKKGILKGQSVLMGLGGGDLPSNLLRRAVAQNAAFETSGGRGEGYPTSIMGAVALLRQTLSDARWQADAFAALAKKPGQRRPAYSPVLESLAPVVSGKQRIFLVGKDVLDTLRLAAMAKEFKLDAVLVGSGEEYKRLDAVVATGYPLVVPIDFPKAPEIGEKDDLSIDLATLRHWDAAPANPKQLADALSNTKVKLVFTADGLSEPKKLHEMAAQAIERGLTADQVLAAFTTEPAKLLGIDERAGTIEVGKAANLVIAGGPLFAKETKISAVFVDGIRFEVKESKKPTVEPAGEWALTIEAGPQVINMTLKLEGKAEALKAVLHGPTGPMDVSAETSGDTVEVSFDGGRLGMPGTIKFNLKIAGNSASGSGTSPAGNFTVKAERSSAPPAAPEVRQ
jgi:hypothetical protein